MVKKVFNVAAVVALLALPEKASFSAPAAPNPAYNPRAARSVHLGYPAPEGTLLYNEATVEESVHGSYFMACGFQRGYFGIQELGRIKYFRMFVTTGPPPGI